MQQQSDSLLGAAHGMTTRRLSLHPARPEYMDAIAEMALTGAIDWPWGGRSESAESFRESSVAGVLCQFVAVTRLNGAPVGLVRATGANFFHRFAYLQALFPSSSRGQGLPAEALAVFVDYLFRRYAFRNLYAEMIQPVYDALMTGSERLFDVEGRFREHALHEGEFVDKVVLTVRHQSWLEQRERLLKMVGSRRDAYRGDVIH